MKSGELLVAKAVGHGEEGVCVLRTQGFHTGLDLFESVFGGFEIDGLGDVHEEDDVGFVCLLPCIRLA